MKKLFVVASLAALSASAEIVRMTPLSKFVEGTNAVLNSANGYTDEQIAAIPAPDFSPANTQLVATIRAESGDPGNYAAVSNAAMTAVETSTNYTDAAIGDLKVDLGSGVFMVGYAGSAGYAASASKAGYLEDLSYNTDLRCMGMDDGGRLRWTANYGENNIAYLDDIEDATNGLASASAVSAAQAVADAAADTNAAQTAQIDAIAGRTNTWNAAAAQAATAIQSLEPATNYTDSAIADADTSYRRFAALTNVNQSVQYVTSGAALAVRIPTGDAATKDWIIYCNFAADTPLVLPAATWWMADEAYTNAIPANQPTALYFSQVAEGVFTLGRQELTTIQVTE